MNSFENPTPSVPSSEKNPWDALKNLTSKGRAENLSKKVVEESEYVPKRDSDYQMEVNEHFDEDLGIKGKEWQKMYRRAWVEKGDNEEKTKSYEDKVTEAIEAWNDVSEEDRSKFLKTGEQPESISNETVSLLTSARLINFAEEPKQEKRRVPVPPPVPPVPVPPPVPIPEPIPPEKETILDDLRRLWDGILGWGRRRSSNKPEQTSRDDRIEDWSDDEPSDELRDDLRDESKNELSDKSLKEQFNDILDEDLDDEPYEESDEELDDETDDADDEDDKDNKDDDGGSGGGIGLGLGGVSGLTGDTSTDDKKKSDPEKKQKQKTEPEKKDKSEDKSEDPEKKAQSEEEGEKPKEQTYDVIKRVYMAEVPAEVQEKVSKGGSRLLKRLRYGAIVSLLALALLKPDHEALATAGNARVATSSTQIELSLGEETRHIDDQIITEEVEVDKDSEKYRALSLEKLMKDTKLGDEVFVAEGTEYWESPDHEFGGANRHGKIDNDWIRPEGNYTIDRLVVLDKENGKYVGNYYIGNGDTGTLEELVNKAVEGYDNPVTVHFHLNNPTAGWTKDILSGDVIKTDETFKEQQERVIPGFDYTVPVINKNEVTTNSVGENVNLRSGLMTIVGDDGTVSTINIMHEDGSYYKAGESVVDSNGRVHTIQEIEVNPETHTTSVNRKNVLWNLAMVGLAGTGIMIGASALKRRKEEEAGETEATETNTVNTAPRYEKVRDMMELTAGQLVKLTDIFDEVAGERAPQIAEEMAGYAGIEVSTPDEKIPENSIFIGMDESERTVARALLEKRDEATLEHLSNLLGINLESYAASILAPEAKQETGSAEQAPQEEEKQNGEA